MAKGRPVGIPQPESYKLALSERFKGIPKSAEQKKKMSEASTGRPKSPEHKEAMSKAQFERHAMIKSLMTQHNITIKEARIMYRNNK